VLAKEVYEMKAKIFLSVSLFIGLMSAVSLSAAVLNYGVAADWSDTDNPKGQWAYGIMSTGGIFTPFATHTDHYINVGPAVFSGNQPAWTNTVVQETTALQRAWRGASGLR
jgi:hypothetical protein